MGNRKKITVAGILLAALLAAALIAMSVPLRAAGTIQELGNENAYLTVRMQYTADDGTVTNVSGAEFAIYKVAGLTMEEGKVNYEAAREEYAEIDFNALRADDPAEQQNENAAALRAIIETVNANAAEGAGIEPDFTAVTGADGDAVFAVGGPENYGMYLVVQTGRSVGEGFNAVDYRRIQPYLVMVPTYDPYPYPFMELVDGEEREYEGEYTWVYNVISVPKNQAVEEDEKQPLRLMKTVDALPGDRQAVFTFRVTAVDADGAVVYDRVVGLALNDEMYAVFEDEIPASASVTVQEISIEASGYVPEGWEDDGSDTFTLEQTGQTEWEFTFHNILEDQPTEIVTVINEYEYDAEGGQVHYVSGS